MTDRLEIYKACSTRYVAMAETKKKHKLVQALPATQIAGVLNHAVTSKVLILFLKNIN